MTSTTRRITSIAFILTGLAAACGSSSKRTTTDTSTAPVSSTSTIAASTSSTTTTTTVPVPDVSTAVWPTLAGTRRFTDPVAAARSFATDYLKMTAPVVGAFRPGDARSGEVPVRGTTRGPVTTVIVRQIGSANTWWVLGSATPNIRLTEPAALATITSPVRLRGESSAFEATVNVSIREDDTTTPLAETFTMGGSTEIGPFDASVPFTTPTKPDGAIVMYTISSENGHVSGATVIRVHFARA